jgi:hypothetical protein
VVEAIARGELDDELAALGAVITSGCGCCHRPVDTARSMRTLASPRVGDRVRINHNAKPNYLHGRAGTVSGWAGQNVVVQLDQPIGRFATGELRCPPLVLEPLAPESLARTNRAGPPAVAAGSCDAV